MKQRIVIDTNVLVSALIQRNYPYQILHEVLTGNHIELCISEEVYEEYFQVLNRKKFSQFPEFVENAQILLVQVRDISKMFAPGVRLQIISDIDDNKLLELAETCDADFLITGNMRDFTMKKYKNTRIVSPRDYWNHHIRQ